MLLRTPDANTESASSPTQGAEAQSPSAQQESQQQQPAPAEQEQTLAEVAKEAFDKASQAESEEQQSESSDVQSLDKTQGQEEQPGSKPGEGQQEQQQRPQNDEQLPFHNHPRWKEVLGERDQFKSKAEQFETLAKSQQATNEFCQRFNVTPEQYQQAFTIMALLNTDPAEARKALEPIWTSLGKYDGNTLPSDLQARVDAQEMSEAVAKELAAERARNNSFADRSKLSAHQQQQQAEQRITQSVGQWEAAKKASDPDFAPVQKDQPDGLWENVNHRLSFLWAQNPPRSEQAAVALCERAYADAKKMFSARLPKQQPSKVLNSSRSSQTPRKADPAEAATTSELVRQTAAEVAAKHGISWTPGA